MGAGSAGVGVAKQIVEYFVKEGLTEDEAKRCFVSTFALNAPFSPSGASTDQYIYSGLWIPR